MGYARRKPNTGNPSVRIDEEGEVESPLLYSTPLGNSNVFPSN